ncbi:MAG: ATP-dependent 6-phosphofructokinase [Elusimicrobia bacterium HGW-Elusimicrobia-2]|nr:MAG: ATP-dependent 6-phosphofructokinase [Elusimicrobia bacterium HGW-Elusimicrobia-2]
MNIAVVTTGGDAPGMNAALRAVIRTAASCGMNVTGVRRGWWGLLEDDYMSLNSKSASGIISSGGTFLKTQRCPLSKTTAGMKKISDTLRKIAPDGLIVIGGDGSMRAANAVAKKSGVPVIGIPASIDNDIAGTDETIGFDTALNTALSAIDKIRDTATSHDRVFIAEVMGKDSGFLALSAGLATGAEIILVPEIKTDKKEVLKKIKALHGGKSSIIIVMAEGAGKASELAEYLNKSAGLEVRISKLGYIQRGGSPSVDSRVLAGVLGYEAVMLLKNKKKNLMCAWVKDSFKTVPLTYPATHKKKLNGKWLKIAEVLAGGNK